MWLISSTQFGICLCISGTDEQVHKPRYEEEKLNRKFLSRLSVRTLFIEPSSPWENGFSESFNGKMRDELLAREIFYSVKEAQVLIEMWRNHYNMVRPHSSLCYQLLALAIFMAQPSQIQKDNLIL